MKSFVVLVAIDFSTAGEAAILRALELAAAYPQSEVHVVTVEPLDLTLAGGPAAGEPSVATRLRDVTTQAVARFDAARDHLRASSVVVHVVAGAEAHAIVGLATEIGADLVLVGSHGRRGVARALHGSVAERVVRSAPCPVLVVRDARGTSDEPACAACAGTCAASGGRELHCPEHVKAEVGT